MAVVSAPDDTAPQAPVQPTLRANARTWAVLVVLAAAVIVAAFLCDDLVQGLVPAQLNPTTKEAARLISKYFDWPFMLLYSALPLAYGWLRKKREWQRLGVALMISCAVAGITSTSIRSTTGRTRPNAEAPQGWYGPRHNGKWLIGKSEFNSFPSGHMGTVMGFSGILLLGARRWKALAVLVGAAVGWSRIYLGYHHFSDVTVGALIGLAVGWYTWHRLLPRLARTWPVLHA